MRLFLGISPPDPIRARLADLQSGLPGARWVGRENIHLTLRFIGQVTGEEADALHQAMMEIDAAAFDLSLGGLGFFGSRLKARAVWAAIEPCAALTHLHGKVESAVVRAGFEPERRKFKPHMTLARLKKTPVGRVRDYLEDHGGFCARPFPVGAFTLFRSHLGQSGADYEALFDYPLVDYPLVDYPLAVDSSTEI